MLEPDAVYEAWADGEIRILSKSLSEWADPSGALLPGSRKSQRPGISVAITATEESPARPNRLGDWEHLWRIGEGRIFTVDGGSIRVSTHADVGILRKDVNLTLTETSRLSWEWLVETLPSEIAEDLAFTHDYLSLAIEFDNGRDLTYLWSAELPAGHAFRCPLGWWCERETHVVVRSGRVGLGIWQREDRALALDYRDIIGGPPPEKIIAIWLIANSVFQRGTGVATFRNISLMA